MSAEVHTQESQPVTFQLPSGDKLAVYVDNDGFLKVSAVSKRGGTLLVLPDASNAIRLATCHHPKELAQRKVDLLAAPTRAI